ncbi:MAG: hypothetical protein LBQ06_06395 [Frankiaceae bacterium]|jgi:hypothetical protein|nr:hypothetical protein [Frankiaceae bacterium]
MVETVRVAGNEPTSVRDRAQAAAVESLDQVNAAIVAVAESVTEVIDQLAVAARRPEQVEVTFGLKFAASGNAFVAAVSGEASLEVKLTYSTAGQAPG